MAFLPVPMVARKVLGLNEGLLLLRTAEAGFINLDASPGKVLKMSHTAQF